MTLVADVRAAAGGFSVDAAFSVGAGETVALVGPNGAGKTTLLRAITGLLPVWKGTVKYDDRDVTKIGVIAHRDDTSREVAHAVNRQRELQPIRGRDVDDGIQRADLIVAQRLDHGSPSGESRGFSMKSE